MSPRLSPDNVADHLRDLRLLAPDEPATVRPLTGGEHDVRFAVTGPRRGFVVKQALPAPGGDPSRILVEHRAMGTIRPPIPDGCIPSVLAVDPANAVLVLDALPPTARALSDALADGRPEPRVAEFAGMMLGAVHRIGRDRPGVAARFPDRSWFRATRLAALRRASADVRPAPPILEVLAGLDTRAVTMVHGSYVPANLHVADRRVILAEYEAAHWGDPSFDTGLCVGDLLAAGAASSAEVFWSAYRSRMSGAEAVAADEGRTVAVALLRMRSVGSPRAAELLSSPPETVGELARSAAG
jgi:hypothetical protein